MHSLLASARTLVQPSPEAAAAFAGKSPALAARLNAAMLARPDLDALVGPDGAQMMQNNHRNHALYMESVFSLYDPASFVETVLWVFRTYRAHGFAVSYWAAMLDEALAALREELPQDVFGQVAPFYRWLILHIPAFTALSESRPSAWEPEEAGQHGMS
jgi:hypothetical protein